MERVLIATRGEIAWRLVRWFNARDIETVALFGAPDVDAPWVEEADFQVYVPGEGVEQTYANPSRVLSAAMDAGCDVIHPGYCFLATHLGFFQAAANANVAVVGTSIPSLAAALDRERIEAACEAHGIPRIPSSPDLDENDDGIAEAARIGYPLLVKASSGGARLRVERPEQLPVAVAAVRIVAEGTTGNPAVYLQRAVDSLRTVSTLVVADRHGTVEALGHSDGSLRSDYRSWVETIGEGVVPEDLGEKLHDRSIALARGMDWVGVGRANWALTPRGGWYLLGFSPRLTVGYSLFERAFAVDLIRTQLRLQSGQHLAWDHAVTTAPDHHLQFRIVHVDPATGERPAGEITRWEMPGGAFVEEGTGEGRPANEGTDPLLCKITVSAPTRQAALVRARAALEATRIEGVPTNREALLDLLSDASVWQGRVDIGTLPRFLRDRSRLSGGG